MNCFFLFIFFALYPILCLSVICSWKLQCFFYSDLIYSLPKLPFSIFMNLLFILVNCNTSCPFLLEMKSILNQGLSVIRDRPSVRYSNFFSCFKCENCFECQMTFFLVIFKTCSLTNNKLTQKVFD